MANKLPKRVAASDDPKESVTVSLGTKNGDVQASSVGSSMTGIVALVQEIQQGIAANEQLLVKARPFRKGSFEIPLEFVVVSGGKLFAASPMLERLFELLVRYFETKIALKGSQPVFNKSGELLIDGDEPETSDVLSSLLRPTSHANVEIAKAMSAIERDSVITNFSIFRGREKKRVVRIRREQFRYFYAGLMQSEPTTIARVVSGNRVTTTREELVVRVVALEGNAKWKFNWKGQVISARISDEVFLERVRKSSERFGAGDRLDVELVTTQKFDEATQDYLNASYEISCVWHHDKMPSQRDLFAEDEN